MDVTYDLGSKKGRRKVLSEAKIKDPLMYSALAKIMDRKEYIKNIPKGALAGLAVSSGIVEGQARVVESIMKGNDSKFKRFLSAEDYLYLF